MSEQGMVLDFVGMDSQGLALPSLSPLVGQRGGVLDPVMVVASPRSSVTSLGQFGDEG